ncbi:hypothetical protein [Enhydrobacter sp.]|jgi:hypothetical protein|uniref:hypothetical protein n=1 Tax=Enhydrobacter sp. TaxID=1894999 RepID=UPI002614EDAC|nr:hypothetical protein [Enhydrobacter sp.]WIM09935.1 MAG: hypothetical protein OJF58_000888 [Enhydrobacter sp.]
MRIVLVFLAASLALAWAAHASQPFSAVSCPMTIPDVDCYRGQDANGSYILAAVPRKWSGVLVVHAHGGPRLAPITPDYSDNDLKRFSEFVGQGHALVAASYRRPGYGARMAAEDIESARKAFIARFGKPRLIIVHGQSWGGDVAARVIELYAISPDGTRNYDGALLTSGVIAGATRTYNPRIDLRALFQYYCGTHPRPDEPAYNLGIGLPAASTMSRKELRARFDACTGENLPPDRRSARQKLALTEMAKITRIPEHAMFSHLSWATFLFRDIAEHITGGRSPFGNIGVVYKGSSDDAKLNRDVPRVAADPEARALLKYDSDPTGQITIPVLTLHAIGDPTAAVENEAAYREIIGQAGNGRLLVQVFAREHVHSKLSSPLYPAMMDALLAWIGKDERPSAQSVLELCRTEHETYRGDCTIDPNYQVASFDSRSWPRMP